MTGETREGGAEAVAHALYLADNPYADDGTWDLRPEGDHEHYRNLARGGVAAMSQASPEQVERAAFFQFAVFTRSRHDLPRAKRSWELVLDEEQREEWRQVARQFFAHLANPDGAA